MKNPFSKPSYFKKMTRKERREIFDTYKAEIQNGERPYIARANGMEALNSYKADCLKIGLLVLSLLSILGSIVAIISFYTGGELAYSISVYAERYFLIPSLIISYIVGLFTRKIRLTEYGYHLLLLVVQFVVNVMAPLLILYEIARLGQHF